MCNFPKKVFLILLTYICDLLKDYIEFYYIKLLQSKETWEIAPDQEINTKIKFDHSDT